MSSDWTEVTNVLNLEINLVKLQLELKVEAQWFIGMTWFTEFCLKEKWAKCCATANQCISGIPKYFGNISTIMKSQML